MSKNPYDQFFKTAQEVRRSSDPAPPPPKRRPAPAPAVPTKRSAQKAATPTYPVTRRKKASIPWGAVLGMVFTLALAVTYLLEPEKFESAIAKVEFSAFGQAEASDAKTAETSKPGPAKGEKSAGGDGHAAAASSPVSSGGVPEDLSHYEKLKQRKEELDAREKELAELEEELQRQKVELDKRLQALDEMRNQIAKTLKDRVEVDQEKVNKLVDLYSNMKPKQAAEVIGTINEDLAVEVLAKMKKKNAAEVMNLLTPEKSRVLSEKYMGYRRLASEPKGQN